MLYEVITLKLIDLVIPSLILGQAIGRWGNFVNQEAFGALVTNPNLQFFPLAVYIESLGEWHQATFFYESFCNMILLVVTFRITSYNVCYTKLLRDDQIRPASCQMLRRAFLSGPFSH